MKKVLHKRSNETQGGGAKLPSSANLEYGEIAVNYHDGVEKLFIKNDNDKVKTIRTDNQLPPVEKHEDQEFVYRQAVNENEAQSLRFDRIYGKTLAWNNVVLDGNFSQGTRYVRAESEYVSISFSNGVCTVNTTRGRNGIYMDTGVMPISGHKYYMSAIYTSERILDFRFGGYNIVSAANNSTVFRTIYTASNTLALNVFPEDSGDISTVFTVKDIVIIDLTLMFGEGNEPSTSEEFEAMFPGYHSYEAGKLISNDAESIETVGFNLWDEEWENGTITIADGQNNPSPDIRCKGYIRVEPGKVYYFRVGNTQYESTYLYFYDSNKNYSNKYVNPKNDTFTVPDGMYYVRFTLYMISGGYGGTYRNDICINLSDPAKNGTYEPYHKSTMQLNLGSFQVRDSQGNVTTITGGLKSAGDVHDEIVGNKYIKRVSEYTFTGNEVWIKNGNAPQYTSQTGLFVGRKRSTNYWSNPANVLHPKLITASQEAIYYGRVTNAIGFGDSTTTDNVVIDEIAYTNRASLLTGTMAYYELATPIEYTLVSFLVPTIKSGTIESRISPNPDGLSAPMVADISYTQTSEYILGELDSKLGDIEALLETI